MLVKSLKFVLFRNLNTSPNKMYLVKVCFVNYSFSGLCKRKEGKANFNPHPLQIFQSPY